MSAGSDQIIGQAKQAESGRVLCSYLFDKLLQRVDVVPAPIFAATASAQLWYICESSLALDGQRKETHSSTASASVVSILASTAVELSTTSLSCWTSSILTPTESALSTSCCKSSMLDNLCSSFLFTLLGTNLRGERERVSMNVDPGGAGTVHKQKRM